MEYEIKELQTSSENISHYTSLLQQVFPTTQKYTTAYLTWQYCNNPIGTAIGFDAYYDGKIIAHYATIPVQYCLDGKIVTGLLSLNTATDANHQGKGLFSILANKTYDRAKELGFVFVIGVANQNSTHGFVKKFGFQLIKQLDVKIGFGNIIDDNYQADYKFYSAINEEFIEWKLANPSNEYFASKQSIYAKTEKPMLKAIVFSNNTKHIALPSNGVHFTIFIGLLNNKKLNGLFINLPKKLKRSPLNLIFKPLQDVSLIMDEKDILFDLKDFDSY